MTCFRFFLPGFFVLSAFGQTAQNAVDPTRISKQIVKLILNASLVPTKPVMNLQQFTANGPQATSSCSVPLVEVKIPKDVEFAITQAPPPGDFRDNMPVAKGLPACPTDH